LHVSVGDIDNILAMTWEGYRQRFIQADGRVIRPMDGFDTVSEGQAYALLRAVWMNDRETFNRVYRWTETHLSRHTTRGDHLLAWHWGRQGDGGWGVLDWAAASDADEDYALALLFASRRWKEAGPDLPPYREQAIKVLTDILAKETRRGSDGRLYLLPGDWGEQALVLNPSYFAPAWYRVFANATNDPRWNELVESSYHAIDIMSVRLGEKVGVGLMPDWAMLGPGGGFEQASGLSDAHRWDAFRTPWRVALDWVWFREPRAQRYLAERLFPFLKGEWERNGGKLYAGYSYEGAPLAAYESAATYAGYLPALEAAGSPLARDALEKLRRAVRQDPGGAFFDLKDDYYLNNWAWFGLLIGKGRAVNLWRGQP
jgi:endoglucanase